MKEREVELREVLDEQPQPEETDGEGQIEATSRIGDRLAEIRDLLSEQAKRDSQVDRVERELDEKRGRAAELEEELHRLRERDREAKALALEIEVRTEEIEAMRAALSAERQKVEGHVERLAVQTAKLETGREEIEELRAALRTERDQVESQRDRIAVQTAKLETGHEEIEELRVALSLERGKVEAGRAETRRLRQAIYVDALPRRRGRTALRLLSWLIRLRLHDVRAYLAIRRSGRFDAKYYLLRYPDVATKGENPIIHYVASGAAEGRNPSADFDAAAYVASRPELAESGQNPFLHRIRSSSASDERR